jgi:2-methylcitrate dehydratase PrpD
MFERSEKMTEASEEKRLAQVLAEFLVDQKFEDLPKETLQQVKHYLIDVIGCTVGASKEQQAKVLIEVLKSEGGTPHSSVIANGFKTSVMNAALINGLMGHTFDFDDDHREGTMHPSVAVFPAVFALGQKM